MNKNQENKLETAAAMLTRAEQNKDLQGIAKAYGAIKDAVADIYQGKIDAPTVFVVEKILNQGQANVSGKFPGVYKMIERLTGQAESGMSAYSMFKKMPTKYVEIAYLSRAGVGPFQNKIPYDPVRSALTEFRKQLTTGLTLVTGNPFQDSLDTNKMRFHATVTAERGYLEEFLKHYDGEAPEKKQEHIKDFDKKMKRVTRQIEPPERA